LIERKSRSALLVGASVILASATAVASPAPGFGPSETGCPAFFAATADGPQADPGQVGPFGTSQQHLTGIGLSADAEALTVSLQVQDMRRQAAPGFRWTYWEIFFGIDGQSRGKQLEIYYDAVQDDFSWWAGRFNGTFTYKKAVDGTVVPGPGGGVAIRVPFGALGLEPGIEPGDTLTNFSAEAGDFISYVYMSPPDYLTSTYPSGIYSPQWDIEGPDLFTVMPCPGIIVKGRDLGNAKGVRLDGGALPAESGQTIVVEQQTSSGWVEVASGETDDFGWVSIPVPVAPGPATLRATMTTRMLGDVTSAPVTVTATA
jgi:hypothetical protein